MLNQKMSKYVKVHQLPCDGLESAETFCADLRLHTTSMLKDKMFRHATCCIIAY